MSPPYCCMYLIIWVFCQYIQRSLPCPSKLTNIVHNSQSQGTQKLNCCLITRFHHHFTLRAFKALHWLALLFFFQGTICQIFLALHWYLVKNGVTCIKKGDWTIWPVQFNVRQKQYRHKPYFLENFCSVLCSPPLNQF